MVVAENHPFVNTTLSTDRTEDDCSSAVQPEEPKMQEDHEGPHKCLTCCKSFTNLLAAMRHQKVHAETADFYCSVCKKSFTSERSLKQHIRRKNASGHHIPNRTSSKRVQESDESGNVFSECVKCFSSWKNLLQHRRSVHREEMHQKCKECGALFCRKWNIDRHMKTVH
ncbi:hypothetical protein CRM22_006713 [Opisthorchis felineus]|uniref:C2H2-type domain-containing protein n=1 Tax=Opisthorchis felineus TaxID=147828 RepID=A0A4S2LJT1_OPIFE|nr:hypothetical protein CRM22_006713 [Opisthorchis felineus]